MVQYSKCNIIPQALGYLLHLSDSSVLLGILLADKRVIYQRDNGMWHLQHTTMKEQYHLMQLTYAFKTIIFLAPLIAGKTAGAELPIILAEESS